MSVLLIATSLMTSRVLIHKEAQKCSWRTAHGLLDLSTLETQVEEIWMTSYWCHKVYRTLMILLYIHLALFILGNTLSHIILSKLHNKFLN